MRRVDLIKEVKAEREKNKDLEMSKHQLKAEFKRKLYVVRKQKQELTSERDSLLQQLQQEMSKSEALRQQFLEHEQSQQSIVDWVEEQETQMMLDIEELIIFIIVLIIILVHMIGIVIYIKYL